MLKKLCEKCKCENHPRVKICKCGNKFIFKNKSKNKQKFKKINWKDLVPGDKIKVKGGPYWVGSSGKISMGYKGDYSVVGLDENGIIAYGIGKNSGFCHIWMSDKVKNENKTIKIPHKIKKIN